MRPAECGHQPGKLHGVWREVVAIERRSTVGGIR